MSRIIELTTHADSRGCLVALHERVEVPFAIKRVFYIFGNTSGLPRAAHAHAETSELLICVHGRCTVRCEDRSGRAEVVLDRPDKALFIAPMTWLELTDFTSDCVLLVLADSEYRPDLTITDHDAFRAGLA